MVLGLNLKKSKSKKSKSRASSVITPLKWQNIKNYDMVRVLHMHEVFLLARITLCMMVGINFPTRIQCY